MSRGLLKLVRRVRLLRQFLFPILRKLRDDRDAQALRVAHVEARQEDNARANRERDERIANLEAGIQERDARIAKVEAWATTLIARVGRIEAAARHRDEWIRKADGHIEDQQDAIAALQARDQLLRKALLESDPDCTVTEQSFGPYTFPVDPD